MKQTNLKKNLHERCLLFSFGFLINSIVIFFLIFFLNCGNGTKTNEPDFKYLTGNFPEAKLTWHEILMITKMAYFEDPNECGNVTANVLARWYDGRFGDNIEAIITRPSQYHVWKTPDGYQEAYHMVHPSSGELYPSDRCVFTTTLENSGLPEEQYCIFLIDKHLIEWDHYYRGWDQRNVGNDTVIKYEGCYEEVMKTLSSTPSAGALYFAARNGVTNFRDNTDLPAGENLIPEDCRNLPEGMNNIPDICRGDIPEEQNLVPEPEVTVDETSESITVIADPQSRPEPVVNFTENSESADSSNYENSDGGSSFNFNRSQYCVGENLEVDGARSVVSWDCRDDRYPYCPPDGVLPFTCFRKEYSAQDVVPLNEVCVVSEYYHENRTPWNKLRLCDQRREEKKQNGDIMVPWLPCGFISGNSNQGSNYFSLLSVVSVFCFIRYLGRKKRWGSVS